MILPIFEREWHGVQLAGRVASRSEVRPDEFAAIYAAAANVEEPAWRTQKVGLARYVGGLASDAIGLPLSEIRLLSLGAGTGVMEDVWLEAGCRVALQECQRMSLAGFQERHPAVPVFFGSAESVAAPSGSFDVVVLSGIDYMFRRDEYLRVLGEAHRLLRTDGVAIAASFSHLCAGSLPRLAVKAGLERFRRRSKRVFWGWNRTVGEHLRAGARAGFRLERLCVRDEAGARASSPLAADLMTRYHELLMVWRRT